MGVGSVGTEAFVFLLVSGRERDVLFLQLKQAQASVIAPWVSGPAVVMADDIEHDGQRVVVGQRLMQAASDQFLGWASGGPRESQYFYLRQLRDMKVSVDLTAMAPEFVHQVCLVVRTGARLLPRPFRQRLGYRGVHREGTELRWGPDGVRRSLC